MKAELDAALVKDFPEIFRDRNGDMRTTAMCWGFECGNGWEKLIRTCCEKLMYLSKCEGVEPPVASQVKEKYGSLCFYVWNATEIAHMVIDHYENQSHHICETCGEYGHIRRQNNAPHGWLSCLCGVCAHKNKYPVSSYEAEELKLAEGTYLLETHDE